MIRYRHESKLKKNLKLAASHMIPTALPSGNFLMPDYDKALEYLEKARVHNSAYEPVFQTLETANPIEKTEIFNIYGRTSGGTIITKNMMRKPEQVNYIEGAPVIIRRKEKKTFGCIADIVCENTREEIMEKVI